MTDEALMAAYRDGNLEAFHILYKNHKGRVMGYLVSKLKNRDEAEEVFQEIFKKLHANRHRYRSELPFLPWLFTIARNVLIDYIRKNQTRDKYIVLKQELIEVSGREEIPRKEVETYLSEISCLNDKQKEVLRLRFDEGFSFDEIASHLSTSPANVRKITSRAIQSLRKFLMPGDK